VGIDSLVAIPYDQWSLDYQHPKPACIRKDGKCIQALFLTPPDSKKVWTTILYLVWNLRFMMVNTKTAVFWDATLCSLVNVYWRFRIILCLHLKSKLEAVWIFWSSGMWWCVRWMVHSVLSKYREPFTKGCNITSHKTGLWIIQLWKPHNSHGGCLFLWRSMHFPGYIVSWLKTSNHFLFVILACTPLVCLFAQLTYTVVPLYPWVTRSKT
jgi:hypothetical protein